MNPNIVKSHIYAKDIFKAKKLESKIKYLNLKLITNKKFNNPDPFGIYFMFFKNNLIYIGSWCGNWNEKTRELKDSAANQRWQKHIITDTTRFQNITFCQNNDRFDQEKIQNVIKNHKEKVKKTKDGKVTLNTAIDLYKNKKVDEGRYKNLINSRFLTITNKIKNNYCNHIVDSKICEDVIIQLNNIEYNSPKEFQKILAGGSMAHSLNRFKVSAKYWEDFKKRDEKNIFDDFEFLYFKFKNFIDCIPKDFLKDGLLKDSDAKAEISKRFRDEFEKPFIKKFSPPANDDDDKSDKEFKIIHDISIIDSIKKDLEDKYYKQNFFIK